MSTSAESGGKKFDLSPDAAMALYLAALAGVPELAWQLERLCLTDPGDELVDARGLRPLFLRQVERERRGY